MAFQLSRARWAYRVPMLLGAPLMVGGLFGVLFWGDVDDRESDTAEYIALGVFFLGLVVIGFLDLKVVEWIGPREWFALAVIAAHLTLAAAFVLGGFAPFVIGIADLDLSDVEEIAFECCWTNADEDFGRVFQEYFGLTAILSVFCAPVSAVVWWASRVLPLGRRQ